MVSPRIWVGCAAGDDSEQGVALTQQLINDLRKTGADVVSESAPLSDEQSLPSLQRELSGCQWFILVQTPQGMGSRHVQLALQEALSYLKGGSLRGACLISVSSEGWGDSAPWPEIRLHAKLYAYNGDYLRLRDKLLLDMDLMQITGMLHRDEKADAALKTPLPTQKAPDFQQQPSGSAEQPVPMLSQEALDFRPQPSGGIEPSPAFRPPSSFGGLTQTGSGAAQQKTGRGDRPVAVPLFTMPRFSRRSLLYGSISLFIVVLLLTSALLAKSVASAFTISGHSTPITLTGLNPIHPASTPTVPTKPSTPAQPAPAQPAPTQAPPAQPVSVASQDAGFVFITTSVLPVLDKAGQPAGARCSAQGGTASVPAGYNVVAVDNNAYKLAGQTYLHVAYPDPCQPGLDFSPNATVTNGTGAVGWVAMNALTTTHVVRPQPQTSAGTVWRNCWGPSACANAAYPNATDTLSAKDAELFAWWTGSYWDVHWWHVLNKSGQQASVYGRDWGAFTK